MPLAGGRQRGQCLLQEEGGLEAPSAREAAWVTCQQEVDGLAASSAGQTAWVACQQGEDGLAASSAG